jgi:hypothetical protein
MLVESLLLALVRIMTFQGSKLLTGASGFFFARGERLFLVTSRHVMVDAPTKHYPDRIEIELHTDSKNLAKSIGFSVPLYRNGKSIWRQGVDSAGEIDVAAIEIERKALPATALYHAFTPEQLPKPSDLIEIGSSILIAGFPLGFHDTLHHMPVARQATIASAFGLRFQGKGYFLTDARTHRGTSGAPVVLRCTDSARASSDLPWLLLGVHSARIDVESRDLLVDEALGLNCAWYADILLKLTEN